ncbi:unnamed protein product [Nezara viridula]|uniref:Uncharacterized protein n=1 Tax=Nezara viridula TaxID=85310 RepID=A0A9P0H4H6_NEZVI|nr:unnamed protein product [Nezara viridula]
MGKVVPPTPADFIQLFATVHERRGVAVGNALGPLLYKREENKDRGHCRPACRGGDQVSRGEEWGGGAVLNEIR